MAQTHWLPAVAFACEISLTSMGRAVWFTVGVSCITDTGQVNNGLKRPLSGREESFLCHQADWYRQPHFRMRKSPRG